MNVVIWSLGTRGDVLPCGCLADELAQRGDSVTLVVPRGLHHHVDASRHRIYDAGTDPSALLATDHPFALGGSRTLVDQLRATRAYLQDAHAVYRRLVRVSQHEPLRSANLHILTLASVWLLPVLRQLNPGRIAAAFLQPVSFSARYASVLLPQSLRASFLPRSLGHRLADLAIWLPWRASVEHAAGARLPLAGPLTLLHRHRIPALYGFSRHLCGPNLVRQPIHRVTGMWVCKPPEGRAERGKGFDEQTPHGQPPAANLPGALQAFLDRHSRVVLITFGSQSRTYRRLLLDLLNLHRLPVALVIQTHGAIAANATPNAPEDPSTAPNAMRLVLDGSEGAVNHSDVLRRCSAVVHHGGAGTLHAVTRHGVPSVVVPAAADTYFWADAAQTAGIAPPWSGLAQSTARSVVAAALRAGAEPYATRAREIAARMRSEDGTTVAAQLIHDYV